METRTKIALLVIILLTGIVIGRMVRPSLRETQSSSPPNFETQKHSGGNVTVSVTPLSLKSGLPPSFDVSFETHSVDLDFDVEKVATFSDGTRATYAARWEGTPPGGHHRSGTLRFTPDLTDLESITLTFSNIAGVPTRMFKWERR